MRTMKPAMSLAEQPGGRIPAYERPPRQGTNTTATQQQGFR
jgi:hypothetical protein